MIAILSSITTANRIKRELERQGERIYIIQTPKAISTGGCGYSIKFDKRLLPSVRAAADALRVQIREIYDEVIVSGKVEYRRL